MATNGDIQVQDIETSSLKDKETIGDNEEATIEIKNCNIFVSYEWKAQNQVKKLYNELAKHESFNTFMDIHKIKAGMNLYSSLASNLQQADIVLACVTKDYVKSKNCEREIIYADAFNKPIIPLFLDKMPMSDLGCSLPWLSWSPALVRLVRSAAQLQPAS